MSGKWQLRGGKWSIPLLMLMGYLVLPFWFPLVLHYQQTGTDLFALAPSLWAGLAYAGLLLMLFGLNWLAAGRTHLSPLSIFLATCLFGLPLLFVYPINANDVFGYYLQGQVVLSGASPYLVSPAALPDAAYASLAGEWSNAVSPYGSVWTAIETLIGWLTSGDLLGALLGFKLIGLLSVLGVGWLIFALTEMNNNQDNHARGLRYAILWLWNPAILYMLVIDAHNDGVVLFWILLGVWVWKKYDAPVAATLILLLAPLTKLSGIVPVPFFGLAILRTLPDLQTRIRYIIFSALGAIGLVFVTFLPFGSPFDLLQRLRLESQDGGSFSPLVVIYFIGECVNGIDITIWNWVRWGTPIFIFVSGLLLVGVLMGRNAWRCSVEAYYTYLATAFKFRIWYPLWLFPLALLSNSPYHRRAAYLLLVTSQLSVIFYAHVRIHLLDGDHAAAHFITVPFTFLLPLILPLLAKKRSSAPSNLS